MKLQKLLGFVACDQNIIVNTIAADGEIKDTFYFNTPFGVPYDLLQKDVRVFRTNRIDERLVIFVEE